METAESKPVTAQDSASESASATSDDHVTSTTQSPGAKLNTNQDTVDFSVLETDIASLRNKAFPEIIAMVAHLCTIETANDNVSRISEEKKRKAIEEHEKNVLRADQIKRRRQELIFLCTEKQASENNDISIIDHSSEPAPSSESLRINRSRLAPLSDAVKNIQGQL